MEVTGASRSFLPTTAFISNSAGYVRVADVIERELQWETDFLADYGSAGRKNARGVMVFTLRYPT